MSNRSKEQIRKETHEQLARMDPATREAAIKRTQATMILLNEARRAGYKIETKEQAKQAIEKMRRAVRD